MMTPFEKFKVSCSVTETVKLWNCVSFSSLYAWFAPLVLINKVPFLFLLQDSTSPPQVKSMTFLITNGETFSYVSLSVLVIVRNFGTNNFVFETERGSLSPVVDALLLCLGCRPLHKALVSVCNGWVVIFVIAFF